MNTNGTPRDTICRLLADVDAELHMLRIRRNGLAMALDTFGPGTPADDNDDACPADPDGVHYAGCGCDYTSPDDPPAEGPTEYELELERMARQFGGASTPDPVTEQSIPLEDDDVSIVVTSAAKKTKDFPCDVPGCGLSFYKLAGLKIHKGRVHGPRNAEDLIRVTDPPSPPEVAADVLALRCDDCDFATPVGPIAPLLSHATRVHDRSLRGAERKPRVA